MELDVVVDRFEGEVAVLEILGHTVDWPMALLPEDVAEGDRMVLRWSRVEHPDLSEAEARLERLRRAGPPGDDIAL